MNMRRTAALLISCVALCAAFNALAWDTKTNQTAGSETWDSIYRFQNNVPNIANTNTLTMNEHAELTDITLQQIGAAGVIGKGAQRTLNVIDLNASLFRRNLRTIGTQTGAGAIAGSPLEQRILPAVPQWAGVPDFGYSIDDWINKHHFCPPRPPGNALNATCHVYFGGWLAGFNSSHFGTQAALTYRAMHTMALNLAAKAADLRARVEDTGSPEDVAEHRDKIEEAEMMALYYESAAQHFLQDRWSIGHMWERWSAPDYAQNPYPNNSILSSEVGAASGLLHGSEALTGLPDAVSSPYFEGLSRLVALANLGGLGGRTEVAPADVTPLEMPEFRLGPDGPIFPGLGDERLRDVFDGQFGAEYPERAYRDIAIPVQIHRELMMDCLKASWVGVIRALGQHPQSGNFGLTGVTLSPEFANGFAPDHDCTDAWMTNHAVYLGWVNDTLAPVAAVARSFINTILDTTGVVDTTNSGSSLAVRADWVAVTFRIAWYDWSDPTGTNLARGGLGDLGNARPGNAYGAPNYVATTNFENLPDHAANGIDKEAVFGFFNRANSEYFCTGLEERLRNLRGSDDPVEKEVCRYLAHRAWEGTDPRYDDGVQKEARVGPNGQPVRPICSLFGGAARIDLASYDEDIPQWLHPGYVPIRASRGMYSMAPRNTSSESVANWCDQIPVLNFLDDPELMNEDVVAEQQKPDDEIVLSGFHLGNEQGMIRLETSRGVSLSAGVEMLDWSDRQIRLRLPEDFDPGEDDILVSLTRADGIASVGRFALRLSPQRPVISRVVIAREDREFYRDEGDPAEATIFRLIDPGPLDIVVEFETEMSEAPVNDRSAEFKLGSWIVQGEWESIHRWRGAVEIPGGVAYGTLRGAMALSMQAATVEGVWIDGDLNVAGRQPDTSRRVILDAFPVHIKGVRFTGPDNEFYAAAWSEQPDLSNFEILLTSVLGNPRRRLSVTSAEEIPAEGEARIELELTAPVPNAPQITVGGVGVLLEGAETSWSGAFDLAALSAEARADLIPVVISVLDEFRRNFDADPRTVPTITLPEAGRRGPWWDGFEGTPGANSAGYGGDDTWHKLGPPPTSSLVIVLDGSGSMDDNDKMTNAKAGISGALDMLPANIEVGAIVFGGCGGISSFPFTKQAALLKERLLGVSPGGDTPLAEALARTRLMLETQAHPLSRSWGYLPFSDGEETCDPPARVGAETQRLQASINAHQMRQLPPLGEEEDEIASDDPEENLPDVDCQPATRTAYEMEVRDGGLHLDNISLIEVAFTEQNNGGVCMQTLTTRRFGVYYGESRGNVLWRVNSAPSSTTTQRAGSRDGAEAVEAMRVRANQRLDAMRAQGDVRNEIARAVNASLGKV